MDTVSYVSLTKDLLGEKGSKPLTVSLAKKEVENLARNFSLFIVQDTTIVENKHAHFKCTIH